MPPCEDRSDPYHHDHPRPDRRRHCNAGGKHRIAEPEHVRRDGYRNPGAGDVPAEDDGDGAVALKPPLSTIQPLGAEVNKWAKTWPTTPIAQVYAQRLPKSPCADTARRPSIRRVLMP